MFVLIDVINILLASVIFLIIYYYDIDEKTIQEKCDFTNIGLSNVVPVFAAISLTCTIRSLFLILFFVFLQNKMQGKEALLDYLNQGIRFKMFKY